MLAILALVAVSIMPVAAGSALSHGHGLAEGTVGPTPLMIVKKAV
jgi:hypothetical protein